MNFITGKTQTMKWRGLFLAIMLLIGLLILGSASYAMASDGEECAQNSVSSSDSSTSGGGGDASGGGSSSG
ncbi:MAG: hypothetical protein GX581_03955, partial [Syntrophomonadaceae bacterium]|nr:hypothetical protein [Syntrophomonadaceae bacterium]